MYIYIYINNNNNIQRKLSLRESATTNKFWTAWEMLQPMLRQIGWHCILAKICSQRISFQRRSRLNQCTSSITQHVTPACYSTLRHSITYLISMQFAATLFSYSEGNRRRCNPLEETVCFKIFKHTMVTRQRASVLLHCMIWQKWRRFPNQLAL